MKKKSGIPMIRLLLRSVYLRGHQDANLKTTTLCWEDEIMEDLREHIHLQLKMYSGYDEPNRMQHNKTVMEIVELFK
jgi:hypothetical protein